jgi:hypothetical protein
MDSASALPYGTLLCVSDKPLHGIIKLPGMADAFYRQRVDQHRELVYAQAICCARSLPSSSIAASYAVLPRIRAAGITFIKPKSKDAFTGQSSG